jgi:hypothetical protein
MDANVLNLLDGKTSGVMSCLIGFFLYHSPARRASPALTPLASTFKVLHVILYFGRKKGREQVTSYELRNAGTRSEVGAKGAG